VKSERVSEITEIRYIRDIGLVVSTFNGTIKFFEAISFSEKWVTNNKMRKENQHTNITTFDISVKMGVMATGGVEGRIILIDPYALDVIKAEKAHSCEILKLYVYEEQKQIISIGQDRSIGLWDASRLEKIEIIKDDRI
jgi:WD40 repeat protein